METLEVKDFGLDIKLCPFTNIIGSHASGKTTLLKMLINKIYNPNIYLDGQRITDYDLNYLKANIAVVLNELTFKTEYVQDELLYYQGKLNTDSAAAIANVKRFVKFFDLSEIIESKIVFLTEYEKAYLKILSLLIINPSILGIDGLMTYLNPEEKLKIIKYAKEHDISILNVTTNHEELLLGSNIIVMDHFKIIASGTKEDILSNEKLLSSIGFKLPFIAELSNNLNYYDVVKKHYYDQKSLIGEIWK